MNSARNTSALFPTLLFSEEEVRLLRRGKVGLFSFRRLFSLRRAL